ncbi:MAG: hypothetical protein U0531_07830 [Dehalococcoidia bacterium]
MPTPTPGPMDVLLIIEVAHTSLAYDRRRKIPAHAQAGKVVLRIWLPDTARRADHCLLATLGGWRYREIQTIDGTGPRGRRSPFPTCPGTTI